MSEKKQSPAPAPPPTPTPRRQRSRRRRRRRRWRTYIRRAHVQHISSNVSYSESGMYALEQLTDDLIHRLTNESADIAHRVRRRKTVKARDVLFASRIMFPTTNMRNDIRSCVLKAIENYNGTDVATEGR